MSLPNLDFMWTGAAQSQWCIGCCRTACLVSSTLQGNCSPPSGPPFPPSPSPLAQEFDRDSAPWASQLPAQLTITAHPLKHGQFLTQLLSESPGVHSLSATSSQLLTQLAQSRISHSNVISEAAVAAFQLACLSPHHPMSFHVGHTVNH